MGAEVGRAHQSAVTWSFFRLGKITRTDALFYTLFQFAGAILAPIILFWAIGTPFGHPDVKYATTQPGPEGILVAFVAEFVISFVLMLALLIAINSARFEKAAGAIAAVLITVYIAVESPLSGMSLNPARSFGSALTAGQWKGIWVYFVAPVVSMLLATEVYLRLRQTGLIAGSGERKHCIVCDYKAGPDYPVQQASA
jgi:aquaporin Z